MRRIVLAFILTGLAGCMSGGVRIAPDQLNALKRGETTEEQVIVLLGRPNVNTTRSDGTRIMTYSHYNARPDAAAFIPFIGPMVGGAEMNSNTLMLQFDARGKLIDYTTSQTTVRTAPPLGGDRPAPTQ